MSQRAGLGTDCTHGVGTLDPLKAPPRAQLDAQNGTLHILPTNYIFFKSMSPKNNALCKFSNKDCFEIRSLDL